MKALKDPICWLLVIAAVPWGSLPQWVNAIFAAVAVFVAYNLGWATRGGDR